jgi:hypothetical protein
MKQQQPMMTEDAHALRDLITFFIVVTSSFHNTNNAEPH